MQTMTGIIIYIQKKRGFGFIQGEDKKLFFHESGVIHPEFKKLKAGTEVEYLETDTPKGPAAISVVEK